MDLKGKEITPEERKIIIKLRNEGKTLREIGKIWGRTHFSIQRVINNYTSSKSVISKPRFERPSKLTLREKRKGSIDPGFYIDDVRVRVPEDDIISEKPHITPSRDDFLNTRNVYGKEQGAQN
ncbi:hypothetical protein TNCV_1934231 [Trichonephila clavipes]|nr:hypothetical protein TNCV_1934231 [Trichonephila clavipes]